MNTERQPSTQTISITRVEFTDTAKAGEKHPAVLPGVPSDTLSQADGALLGIGAASFGGDEGKMEGKTDAKFVLPESFVEALKRERPDGINWDRIDLAVAVLKGEKDAVAPKPPEPEPTRQQQWLRKVLETGDQSPHIVRDVNWEAFNTAVKEFKEKPGDFFKKQMWDMDKALRGGRDLKGWKDRGERVGVFSVIMATAMGMDLVMSDSVLNPIFAKRENGTRVLLPQKDGASQLHKWFGQPKYEWAKYGRGKAKLLSYFTDKFVVNGVNFVLQKVTADKSKLVREFNEQIGDFGNIISDPYDDLVNGTSVEMVVRILSQIPLVGAPVEQIFARINKAIETNAITKLTGKAVSIGAGVLVNEYINDKWPKGIDQAEVIAEAGM